MRWLKAALLGSTMFMGLIAPAQAAPLTLVLFGQVFAASWLGAAVSLGFSSIITYGLSALVNVIFPPTSTTSATSSTPQQVTYGDRVNRGGLFGSILDAGEWAYVNEFNNSTELQLVYILSDGWCAGLEHTIFVDGVQHDLLVNATHSNHEVERYTVDTYDALIDIRFHDGRPNQLTDTELVAQGLDSMATFTNMAYVAVTVTSDSSKFSGIPQFAWVTKGLLAYDPRKDTSVGGSGSHRFNDATTWTYTKNPAVLAYHYLRGFYANGILVLGPGLSIADIDFDTAITTMNICDEIVTRPDSTTRARYEVNYKFDESMEYGSVLDVLCQAMGGFHGELQGRVAIWAGTSQSVVTTFTDDDLITDEERTFDPLKQGIILYTGIEGVYTSAKDYNALAYASIINDDFATADGDIRIWSQDYPQVQDAHQAYLLAKQQLFANRFQAVASVCLDIKDLFITVGDWVTWNSANTLRGERTYRVMQTQHDLAKMRAYLTLQEVDESIYDDDATTLDIAVPDRPFDVGGYLTTVDGFTVTATALSGASGEQMPALEFQYTAINDPAVRAVDFEYRTKDVGSGAGPSLKDSDKTVTDGVYYATIGVTAGVLYEARAVLDSLPGRAVTYTAWTTADDVTPDSVSSGSGGTVTIPDNSIVIAKLVGELQARLNFLVGDGVGTLNGYLTEIQQRIAAAENASLLDQLTNQDKISVVSVQTAGATAAVITEAIARVSSDSALAEQITLVTASLGNLLAAGLLQFTANVDSSTSTATISMQVKAQAGDTFADSGIFLKAQADGLGGTISQILINASQLFITDGVNYANAFTFDSSTGTLVLKNLRFQDLLSLDGTSIHINGVTGEETITG